MDIEIIQPKLRDNRTDKKTYQLFKSCLTKDELIKLITDEIKLKEDQMINLVDIIDQASLNEATETQRILEEETERRTEKIREELKRLCFNLF